MTGPIDPEHDAALDWCSTLSDKLATATLAELDAFWTASESKAHREALKKHSPNMLAAAILATRERIDELKGKTNG